MAEAADKKRYILFSKGDGRPDSEKPCAFFNSAAGCRNGANCKFMHGSAQAATAAAPKEKSRANSVVEEPKKEKKAKKEKAVTAPIAPAAPVAVAVPTPVVVDPQEKLVKELQQQLLAQQAMFEAQMKLLQQQQLQTQQAALAAAAATTTVKTEPPKKETKRKQETPAVPNKSPKTIATPVPAAAPAQQVVTQRAVNTLANNSNNDNDSGDDDNEFLFGAVNHVINSGLVGSNTNTPHKGEVAVMPANSPFVAGNEATKALQTSNSKHALHGSAKKQIFARRPGAASGATSPIAAPISAAQTVAPAVPPAVAVARVPAVRFDPTVVNMAALPWAQLVALTQAHNRFNVNYTFQEDSTWVKAKPFGDWCAKGQVPAVLAMDCEMCETTDPVTGEACGDALVRLSVVDCLDNGRVLIDQLVNPGLPISNARTNIHGITEQQMESATWTLRHAQAALLKICSDRTVLVGHSLCNDLKALKFSHRNVVDTSYLYTLEGEPGASPSLRDVSDQILGQKMNDTHDSVEDARSSLYAAAVLLLRGPQLPVIRKTGNPSTYARNNGAHNGNNAESSTKATGEGNSGTAACSLFVHRIPDFCTEQHVQEMIVAYTQVMPTKVNPITRGASGPDAVPAGKTTIFFLSQLHADLAFESIPGPNRPDKQGRDQKRVYFKGGGYICVRK